MFQTKQRDRVISPAAMSTGLNLIGLFLMTTVGVSIGAIDQGKIHFRRGSQIVRQTNTTQARVCIL